MSEPSINWKQLKKFLDKNGYEIYSDGGDKVVFKGKKKHRIGHRFCNSPSDVVSKGHLAALKRKFRITREDILSV